MLTVPSVSQHKLKYNPVLKNGRSGKGQVVLTTLTALCVSLKIQVSGILFNNLEAAAHPLPTVPPCHNLGAPAWSTHLRSFSPRKPAGPVRAMAPTCGTNLGHQPAVQVPIKPLTQTSVQVSTFQVSSFLLSF